MGSQLATRHGGGRAARGAPGAGGAPHVQEHRRERERRAQQLGLADDARDRLGVRRVQREQRRCERGLRALRLRVRSRAALGGLARQGGGTAEQRDAGLRAVSQWIQQPVLRRQPLRASCSASTSVFSGAVYMALVHASSSIKTRLKRMPDSAMQGACMASVMVPQVWERRSSHGAAPAWAAPSALTPTRAAGPRPLPCRRA